MLDMSSAMLDEWQTTWTLTGCTFFIIMVTTSNYYHNYHLSWIFALESNRAVNTTKVKASRSTYLTTLSGITRCMLGEQTCICFANDQVVGRCTKVWTVQRSRFSQKCIHNFLIFLFFHENGMLWVLAWIQEHVFIALNSFPASGELYHLLKTFANSLDPDQAWQNVGPDLDPNCLTLWWYFWKFFLKKLIF